MALLARGTVSLDVSTGQFAPQISGLFAGEDLDAGAACFIAAADGLVYQSNGVAVAEHAKVDGFTPRATASGQPVTLYGPGARFRYGAALTPGANYYLHDGVGVDGRLDTAATLGGTVVIARAINATDIVIMAKE